MKLKLPQHFGGAPVRKPASCIHHQRPAELQHRLPHLTDHQADRFSMSPVKPESSTMSAVQAAPSQSLQPTAVRNKKSEVFFFYVCLNLLHRTKKKNLNMFVLIL